jgi:hypothetical protein
MGDLMDEYKLSAKENAALKLLHRSLKKKREADLFTRLAPVLM